MTTDQLWWNGLIETALLGTERHPPDLTQLPPALNVPTASLSPEQTVLRGAALAGNYLRAGAEPLTVPLPDVPVCPPEPLPHAPPAAVRLLADLLNDRQPNQRLLSSWLTRCRDRGWVVPPTYLTRLLDNAKRAVAADELGTLRDVLGERGRWLATLNPAWAYVLPNETEAIDLDEAGIPRTWWADASTKERVAWVRSFRFTLTHEPFLREALRDLEAVRQVKEIHLTLKHELTTQLLGLPDGSFFAETRTRLTELHVREKRSLLLQKTRTLHVPDDEQASFIQVVRRAHPVLWTQLLSLPISPVIKALRDAVGETKPVADGIVMALREAVIRHRLTDWASELIAYVPEPDLPELLALLPQNRYEDRLMNTAEWLKNPARYNFLVAPDAPRWSVSFSRFVWAALGQLVVQQYQFHPMQRQFIANLIPVIDPIIRDENPYTPPVDDKLGYGEQMVRNQLVSPVVEGLTLLEKINKL